MQIINILPRKFRERYIADLEILRVEDVSKYYGRTLVISVFIALAITILAWLYYKFSSIWTLPAAILALIIVQFFFYFKTSLEADSRVRKMELVFPDLLQLMSSNLRAGMTVDNSLILSARPEFAPLDEEIKKTGKEITTGRDVGSALVRMANRLGSDKIRKTIYLIISGLKAGGNLADLIEQTGRNMRQQDFNEKRVSSGVLMYVIFIFFAVAAGAPILFSLSSILVEVLIKILGSIELGSAVQTGLPFMMTSIKISPTFITGFTIAFILFTDVLASLIIGLVQNGEEKRGLKYLVPLVTISLLIYFVIKVVLRGYFFSAFEVL
jgi:flagellar protein FlaJ